MLAMHERALFARAPSTARAAALSLDWLLEHGGESRGVPEALLVRAQAGLGSLFPTVRDLCFLFLLRHSARLGAWGDALPQAARTVASVELESLEWVNGEAMFPPDERIRDDAMMRGGCWAPRPRRSLPS